MLAEKVGTHFVQISQYENNHVAPSFERIMKLADVFGIDVAAFGPPSQYRHWQRVEQRDEKTAFSQLIVAARKKLHLSQLEVASAIGISSEMVGYYEVGKFQPQTLEKAIILGKVLLLNEEEIRAAYNSDRQRVQIIQGKKWCSAGKHMVPIKFFHRSRGTKVGLHSYCKFCREEKRKEKLQWSISKQISG